MKKSKNKLIKLGDMQLDINSNGFTLWDNKTSSWIIDASTIVKEGRIAISKIAFRKTRISDSYASSYMSIYKRKKSEII